MAKQCERDGCEVTFEPQRSTARFCSARCRVAAGRKASPAPKTITLMGTRQELIATGSIAYPCCQHCAHGRSYPAHADPCRQGCPA
jgi:hypothetical protein